LQFSVHVHCFFVVQYKYGFSILVFKLHVITEITSSHDLKVTWRARALEMSLVSNLKMILNLILALTSKGLFGCSLDPATYTPSTQHLSYNCHKPVIQGYNGLRYLNWQHTLAPEKKKQHLVNIYCSINSVSYLYTSTK